jgi:hypothetical protein
MTDMRYLTGTAPIPPVVVGADGTFVLDGVLLGPKYGEFGPRQVLLGVWNQADIGYCYETNNVAENLPALWASRRINTYKPGHPDGPLEGRATQLLAAVKAAGLMMIAAPLWDATLGSRPDTSVLDFRALALDDPYWRVNWINYQISDEIDLQPFPLSTHKTFISAMSLGGVRKPIAANLTRRVSIPSLPQGTGTIHWREAFNVPELTLLSIDSYEWHLTPTLTNSATPSELRSSGDMFISTWHGDGIYTDSNPATAGSIGRRFTASASGRAVHMIRFGPISPGRSDDGLPFLASPTLAQYPPIAFNDPEYTVIGIPILPQPMNYGPNDKATGHYVATGRVDVSQTTSYPRAGQWQPGRFLRNESYSGFVHGSCALYLFPQTVGSFTAQGYVDAGTNTVVVTSAPVLPMIGGAMRVIAPGGAEVGWITRDNPQVSGTTGSTGTYTLDPAKRTPVTTGSVGTPLTLTFGTEARPWGDDTNLENLAELAGIIDNLERMQAHPTGGNLMIDTVQGGRRAFSTMRCPDINGDLGLYREDMTIAPIQAGYTSEGVAILDDADSPPLWDFGWPMGFEGFRVTGDDGAVYSYVRSMSNSNRPTFFPGYAALGLPARVFGPFELVGFRRVGAGGAVEMTGTSGVIKAGVDDGAATWFLIETAAIAQNEGNSGNTAYAITVRRGGDLSGTDTVTATVSGTGANPANAADFGGSFPSQVLSFAPDEATKVFTVNVSGDTAGEQNETFAVTLSSPSTDTVLVGSGKDRITCTITNDDAAVIGAFIFLGLSLTGAPAIAGAPLGAVHLNENETTNVTRGGVTMRSRSSQTAYNGGLFADLPGFFTANKFSGVLLDLPAGSWEVGFISASAGFGGGVADSVLMVDDPLGAEALRRTQAISASGTVLVDTDNTAYTSVSTALADAIDNLTYVAVTVSDLGGTGRGLLQLHGTGGGVNLCAVAIREVA